jgi:hypothetical protein
MKVKQYAEDGIPEARLDLFVEQTHTKCVSRIVLNAHKVIYVKD